jgi:oligosaccharide repeat unit polymerase
LKKSNITNYQKVDSVHSEKKVVIGIFAGFILECLYSGGIPLVNMYINDNYNYKDFGIPTFHILFITFLSFYTTYLFHVYLSLKKRSILVLYILCNLIPLLMVYRSISVMIFLSSLFTLVNFLKSERKIKKQLPKIAIITILFFYAFGLFGNIRVNTQAEFKGSIFDSSIIYAVGEATLQNSNNLLSPLYWTYLYTTSPLANFQLNADYGGVKEASFNNIVLFLKESIIYDFIVNRIFETEEVIPQLISPLLTATTMFTDSYIVLGWLGPVLLFSYIVLLFFIYIKIVPSKSDYYITGLSLFNSLVVLGVFANMFSYSPFGFSLVYPMLFSFVNKLIKNGGSK